MGQEHEWIDCPNKYLSDKRICARCAMTGDEINELTGVQSLGDCAGAESANAGSREDGTKAEPSATKPSSRTGHC